MKKLMFTVFLCIGLLASYSYAGNKPDKEVQKAFELRLNGKVDEAKAMLEGILARDSTNAMAWYEMARLNHYMTIGKGEMKMETILIPIDKAVTYDPKNVTYAYYKALSSFLNAFMAMQMGQEGEVKSRVEATCTQFEKVLTLKPDYYEARLYLVEIYGLLPRDMGGDSAKAVSYAGKLETQDTYFGAKARAVLAPQSTDQVKYWEDLLAMNPKNPEFMKEAGKACLFKDDLSKAEKYFDDAIKANPKNNILILDLARYHIMQVMQNQDLAKTELPVAKTYLEKYLKTVPDPIIPLKAYTLGLMSMVERFLGNQAESENKMKEAETLDKYFSKASGIPTLMLFDPPDQVTHNYFSFFSPF